MEIGGIARVMRRQQKERKKERFKGDGEHWDMNREKERDLRDRGRERDFGDKGWMLWHLVLTE